MSFTQGTVNQQMQQPVGQAQGTSGLPSAACVNPALYSSQALSPSQQMFNMTQHQAAGPPGWVSELIEDVKQIKLSMTKLDQIERTVNMINMKVSDLEVKVNHIEPRVTEVEKSCSFIGRENDDRKKELEKARSEIGRLRTECTNMQSDANVLKVKNAALEAKVTDLESRSMRDNLLFYGITERGHHENCEGLVKEVCVDTLGLQDAENMTFDRVHRVGTFSKNKVRPIVAKFHYYKERETVRQKAYENSTALKRENLGIGQQWPSEVRETRKALFPIMQREKSKGKEVKLIKDKLYVNDIQYKLTPQERQSQQSAPQTPRYAPPPPPSYPPWLSYQNHGPPSQFGYMSQQSPQRPYVPPPPPVPPGHPGTYPWTSPVRMAPAMHQPSQSPHQPPVMPQQSRQPTPTQQQNLPAQQGSTQPSGQSKPANPQEMQHDGR